MVSAAYARPIFAASNEHTEKETGGAEVLPTATEYILCYRWMKMDDFF